VGRSQFSISSIVSINIHPFTKAKSRVLVFLELKMTITATPSVKEGCLLVRGKVVSTGVPENVVVSPVASGAAFIGATSTTPSSRHVFSLGVLG
jgi:hypothetical protein